MQSMLYKILDRFFRVRIVRTLEAFYTCETDGETAERYHLVSLFFHYQHALWCPTTGCGRSSCFLTVLDTDNGRRSVHVKEASTKNLHFHRQKPLARAM